MSEKLLIKYIELDVIMYSISAGLLLSGFFSMFIFVISMYVSARTSLLENLIMIHEYKNHYSLQAIE